MSVMSADSLSQKTTNEQNSCLFSFNKRVTIPLLPNSIANEIAGIESFIKRHWIRKYVKDLNGFLVDCKNIQLLGESGAICDDLPFIFWEITADFQVFRPEKDALIKGVVTKLTLSHVHCSVVGDIRASIKVLDESHDYERFLCFGRTVYFKVDETNLSSGVIKGKIDEECIQKMTSLSSDEEYTEDYSQSTGDESNFVDFFS